MFHPNRDQIERIFAGAIPWEEPLWSRPVLEVRAIVAPPAGPWRWTLWDSTRSQRATTACSARWNSPGRCSIRKSDGGGPTRRSRETSAWRFRKKGPFSSRQGSETTRQDPGFARPGAPAVC